jgi:amino acid transporter
MKKYFIARIATILFIVYAFFTASFIEQNPLIAWLVVICLFGAYVAHHAANQQLIRIRSNADEDRPE